MVAVKKLQPIYDAAEGRDFTVLAPLAPLFVGTGYENLQASWGTGTVNSMD